MAMGRRLFPACPRHPRGWWLSSDLLNKMPNGKLTEGVLQNMSKETPYGVDQRATSGYLNSGRSRRELFSAWLCVHYDHLLSLSRFSQAGQQSDFLCVLWEYLLRHRVSNGQGWCFRGSGFCLVSCTGIFHPVVCRSLSA